MKKSNLPAMKMFKHAAQRYVTPLREGGSLPAIVDTDGGLFVTKFVGAGQGARALVAELLVGQIASAIGLAVPDVALIDLAASFGRTERDPEIQDLLKASVGTNVGLRYLDGALNFDPVAAADIVNEDLATRIVWLDAFVSNVDRTARNPNMLVHDESLWLIDHGAALIFHHDWTGVTDTSMQRPFAPIAGHVLLERAGSVAGVHADLAAMVAPALPEIVATLPDELLMHAPDGRQPPFLSAEENRRAYVDALSARLGTSTWAVAVDEVSAR